MTTQQQTRPSKAGQHLPTRAQLTRIADIAFKVGLIVSIFLFPFILMQRETDTALLIATLALAVALPALALAIISTFIHSRMVKSATVLGGIGSLSCFIALTAAFWHLSWVAALIFVGVALIGDTLIAYLN